MKHIQFAIIYEKEKQQFFTFKLLEADDVWQFKLKNDWILSHQTDFQETVDVKTQILELLLRERRDMMIIKCHIHIQQWVGESLINGCGANTELISHSLCCTALNLSEHAVYLWGKYEASFSVWIVRVLFFLHVFSDDSKSYSVLFPLGLIMSRTTCLYLLGTSGYWRNLKLNSIWYKLCTKLAGIH